MRRTVVPILVIFLACGIAVALSHLRLRSQSSQNPRGRSASDSIAKSTGSVRYRGVSFAYDPSLASEVKSQTIPATTAGKPEDISPEHPSFTLVGYPLDKRLAAGAVTDPTINVYLISTFREAMATGGKEFSKGIVYPPNLPEWTLYFDEEIRTLQFLIAKKPLQANVRSVIAEARHSRDDTMMPYLPGADGTMAFVSHLRYVNFKSGKGVFFLTQWDTDTSPITNEGLEYLFQGITDDGQYYIRAEFSVTAPFLPLGSEPEVIAWGEKNYLLPKSSKEYRSYLRPTLEKLEALPADQFRPNLSLIENLIESLQIDTEQSHPQ